MQEMPCQAAREADLAQLSSAPTQPTPAPTQPTPAPAQPTQPTPAPAQPTQPASSPTPTSASAPAPTFAQRNKGRVVTLALIAINIAVFACEVVCAGYDTNIPNKTLVEMGAMFPLFVGGPETWYRFITPMFLHMDVAHIAFNMVALFSVGELLERSLGKLNFLLVYFIAGITGNVASYAADMLFSDGLVVSAGASTSVFGLFLAVAMLGLLHKGDRAFFAKISRGVLSIIGINVAFSLLAPGISISGHLGGAFGGALAMLMVPSKNLRVSVFVRILVTLVWIATLAVIFVYFGLIP